MTYESDLGANRWHETIDIVDSNDFGAPTWLGSYKGHSQNGLIQFIVESNIRAIVIAPEEYGTIDN